MIFQIPSSISYWDLGSLNARLYTPDLGLYSDIPTVLVRNRLSGDTERVGAEALALSERVPSQLEFVEVVKRGRIADPALSHVIEHMMGPKGDHLLSKVMLPVAVVGTPKLDKVHIRALKKAFQRVGFGQIVILPQSLAIVVGHQGSVDDALVCDFGAGKTEFAAVGGERIVSSRLVEVGGNDLDVLIKDKIEIDHDFSISLQDARALKAQFSFNSRRKKITLFGKDLKLGGVGSLSYDPLELGSVFEDHFEKLICDLQSFISSLPTSQMQKIRESGIILSGGMSLIDGLPEWIASKVELQVNRVHRQHLVSLLGMVKLYQDWSTYSYLELNDAN